MFAAALAAALLLLLLAGGAGAQQPQMVPSPPASGTCNISQSCVAKLHLETQTRPELLSNFTRLASSLLACVGGLTADAIKPARLLLSDGLAALVPFILGVLEQKTGFQIRVDTVPYNTIGTAVLDTASNGLRMWDGWNSDSRWTGDLASRGMLLPLDGYIKADSKADWQDVHKFFRQSGCVYDNTVIGLPTSGAVAMMYSHKDMLAQVGMQPPSTWEQLIEVAKALEGRDLNGDGKVDAPLCFDNPAAPMGADVNIACEPQPLAAMILSSITQYRSSASGWLLDPDTLAPLTSTKAMTLTLDIMQRIFAYNQRKHNCGAYRLFLRRECAIVIQEAFREEPLFGVLQLFHIKNNLTTNPFWNQVNFSPIPGSHVILDRETGELVPCSSAQCPHGTPDPATGQVVNRAHFGVSTFIGSINSYSTPDYKQAMYDSLAFFSSYGMSMTLLLAGDTINPYRLKHMSTTASNVALWRSKGFNGPDVVTYLNAYKGILDSTNIALELRMASATDFKTALADATRYISSSVPIAAVQSATEVLINATLMGIPRQKLAETYWASLNLDKQYHDPPPPSLTPLRLPPAPPSVTAGGGKSSGLAAPALIGVLVACVAVTLALAGLAAWLFIARRLRGAGAASVPLVSPKTTLVITDIENSTVLWEAVEQQVMDQALQLHHQLARQLLRKWRGYESCTEGDSFVLSFHGPVAALHFASEFQAGLLTLEWPEDLLRNACASPVWVKAKESGALGDMLGLKQNASQDPSGSQGFFDRESRAPVALARPSLAGLPAGGIKAHRASSAGAKHPLALPGVARAASLQPSSQLTGEPSREGSAGDEGPGTDLMMIKSFAMASVNLPTSEEGPGSSSPRAQRQPSRARKVVSFRGLVGNDDASAPVADKSHRPEPGHLPGPHKSLGDVLADDQRRMQSLRAQSFLAAAWQQVQPRRSDGADLDKERGSPSRSPADVEECSPDEEGVVLLHRGLRVRLGMHSGVHDPQDVAHNKTTGHHEYRGQPMALTKLVGNAGHGGQVLLSEAAFQALVLATSERTGDEPWRIVHMGEWAARREAAGAGGELRLNVFQAVLPGLEPRAALLGTGLRGLEQRSTGALDAPVHHAAIAFAHVVGASTLLAWNRDVATRAFATYHAKAAELLAPALSEADTGRTGYVVELATGLSLTAFHTSTAALAWGLQLLDELLHAQWEPELLEHELCEEMYVGGSVVDQSSVDSGSLISNASWRPSQNGVPTLAGNPATRPARLLFRGLRLKVGVDVGSVHANINPTTGRMAFRGRVMNRTARIADKTGAGQVWCSELAWSLHLEQRQAAARERRRPAFKMAAHALGKYDLKGVGAIDLMQVTAVQRAGGATVALHQQGRRVPEAHAEDGDGGQRDAGVEDVSVLLSGE